MEERVFLDIVGEGRNGEGGREIYLPRLRNLRKRYVNYCVQRVNNQILFIIVNIYIHQIHSMQREEDKEIKKHIIYVNVLL